MGKFSVSVRGPSGIVNKAEADSLDAALALARETYISIRNVVNAPPVEGWIGPRGPECHATNEDGVFCVLDPLHVGDHEGFDGPSTIKWAPFTDDEGV